MLSCASMSVKYEPSSEPIHISLASSYLRQVNAVAAGRDFSRDQRSIALAMGSDQGIALRHMRLIDSCITQLNSQGTSRTCNESKEEEVSSR